MSAPGVAVTRVMVARGDTQIEVLAQGQGHPIVLLPSLGRGASDFDAIAERLAAAAFRVLRPEPRGIGASRGPMTGIDLHTYAADIAVVIEQDRSGAAFVVGHASAVDRIDEQAALIPCPDCGGSGIAHCCDGICEQPGTPGGRASDQSP